MWGVRLPHAAAARLTGGEEGCALEPCSLPDPEAQGGGLVRGGRGEGQGGAGGRGRGGRHRKDA